MLGQLIIVNGEKCVKEVELIMRSMNIQPDGTEELSLFPRNAIRIMNYRQNQICAAG